MKMFKDISTKYYQDNKERQQKKLVKDIKVFLKKQNSNNMLIKETKTFQKTKNKSFFSIKK